MKYWFAGQRFAGLDVTGNDPGTMSFWFQGLPDAWQPQLVNASVSPSGASATAAAGTLSMGVSHGASLAGIALTALHGTLVIAESAPLSGVAMTAHAGTVVAQLSVKLAGVVSTMHAGNLRVFTSFPRATSAWLSNIVGIDDAVPRVTKASVQNIVGIQDAFPRVTAMWLLNIRSKEIPPVVNDGIRTITVH